MKLLSVDVGMKNLAFCLLDVKPDKSYTIDDWQVVDICDGEKLTCCHSACQKDPKYVFNTKHYCRSHAKQTPLGIPTPDLNTKKIRKLTLKQLYAFAEKHKIEFDKPILKAALAERCVQYVETHFVGLISKPKATELDLIQLGRNMTKHFDVIFHGKTIDCLLIENQISPLANRMKTLQGMITQYFIMHGVGNIKFVSSSNKLKEFSKKPVSTYNERKKLGIEVTHDLLTQPGLSPQRKTFETSKKKDDLSDSFLQALWFIKTTDTF